MAAFEEISTREATLADVEALFEKGGEADSFGWAEETIQWMWSRADSKGLPRPPVKIATGPLHVDSLRADSPWALLVDGDLHATGDLDFSTEPYDTSLLVVFGDVKARNFRFNSGAKCFVSGKMELSGCCFGDHGDEAAALFVSGLSAQAVLLDHVTDINLPLETLDAVVCASEGWGLPLHIDYSDEASHADIFVPEVVDDGIDLAKAWVRATGGGELFLPGVLKRLGTLDPDAAPRQKP